MSIESKHAYRFGYLKSEQWSSVRLKAMVREDGKCQICGQRDLSNDAHHVWYPHPVSDTTEEHLVILCRPCHDFLHAMIPDCKTGNEEIGRERWIQFRTAIELWRVKKHQLFDHGDVAPVRAKELRRAYENLKLRFLALQEGTQPPPPSKRHQVKIVMGWIRKWAAAYEESAESVKTEVADSENQS